MQNISANLAEEASSLLSSIKGLVAHSHSTSMEYKTRETQNFKQTEDSLPRTQNASSPTSSSFTEKALSELRICKPEPHHITADNIIWLLDNTAYRNTQTGEWEAEFVAAAWEKNSGVDVSNAVANLCEKLGILQGSAEAMGVEERLMPFVREIRTGGVLDVDFAGHTLRLGPGGPNAISCNVRNIPEGRGDQVVTSTAIVPTGTGGVLDMRTYFAEPEGWGLISDIDDSIKITYTSSPLGILSSTFISTPTPISGMPELYSLINNLLQPSIFYLSASPYNLYHFLSEFRKQHYPQGTMILRDASWQNLSGLLSNLTSGVQAFKAGRMEKIHGWLPKRKMICVGDSTQSDPEAYGEIFRKYPGWVHLILIRKVIDIDAVGITEKNEPARFEKAFEGVPKENWHVFEEPDECHALIEKLRG